jgi:hypothetical protein
MLGKYRYLEVATTVVEVSFCALICSGFGTCNSFSQERSGKMMVMVGDNNIL